MPKLAMTLEHGPQREVGKASSKSALESTHSAAGFGTGLACNKKHPGDKHFHSNPISFEMICRRMIRFATDASNKGDPQILTLILDVLSELLCYITDKKVDEKHRWLDDVSERGLHDKQRQISQFNVTEWFEKRQSELAGFGVCDMVLQLLMSRHTRASMGDGLKLRVSTLHLASALLEGGNQEVQQKFVDSLVDNKHDAFFAKLHADLRHGMLCLREKRDEIRTTRAHLLQHNIAEQGHVEFKEGPHWKGFENLQLHELVSFLQCLVEGHFRQFQELFNDQKRFHFRNSHNIIESCANLLKDLVGDATTLKQDVDQVDCRIIYELLDFLKESCQGPCALNQDFLLKSGIIDIIKVLLAEGVDGRTLSGWTIPDQGANDGTGVYDCMDCNTKTELWQDTQSLAVQLLQALLEGKRDGSNAHRRLTDDLQPQQMATRLSQLLAMHLRSKKRNDSDRQTRKDCQHKYTQRTFDVINLCKTLSTGNNKGSSTRVRVFGVNPGAITLPRDFDATLLVGPLKKVPTVAAGLRKGKGVNRQALEHWPYDKLDLKASDFNTVQSVRSIEINWEGVGLCQVYFPKPSQTELLKEEEKGEIMVDLDFTSDEKVRKFLEHGDDLHIVLKYRHRLRKFRMYQFANQYFEQMQQLGFFFAVVVNTALVAGLEQDQYGGSPTIPVNQTNARAVVIIVGLCQLFNAIAMFAFLVLEQLYTTTGRELRRLTNKHGTTMNLAMLFVRSREDVLSMVQKALDLLKSWPWSCWRHITCAGGNPGQREEDNSQNKFRPRTVPIAKVAAVCVAIGLLGLLVFMYLGTLPHWGQIVVSFFLFCVGCVALRKHWSETIQPLCIAYCCIYDILTTPEVMFYAGYTVCVALGTLAQYRKH